ncbi:MAG TPA: DUF72 domain-containing protein [Tepidiformaceae bacterium]|nr:DUF72 domain-containing protein [Tepidiformaceae bacterium]
MAGTPILLGTASWADKPLVESGKFYPPGATTPEERLRYYATKFPLVEADTTYYGLPQSSMVQRWVERTPDGFTFDVKAFSLFTEHPAPVARLPKELQKQLPGELREKKNLYRDDAPPEVVDYCWSTFIDGLMPLYEAKKLGVIVFQFPKWVFPNRRTWKYFEEIKDRLGPYRAAMEFRNDVWMRADNREETLARLGDLDFTYICVDEPQGFKSSVPPVVAATNGFGFVRFHGRNRETWEKRTKTSAERFDYWYSAEELDEWLPAFKELARDTRELHAVMNTNNSNQGPANAMLLGERLAAAGFHIGR